MTALQMAFKTAPGTAQAAPESEARSHIKSDDRILVEQVRCALHTSSYYQQKQDCKLAVLADQLQQARTCHALRTAFCSSMFHANIAFRNSMPVRCNLACTDLQDQDLCVYVHKNEVKAVLCHCCIL